MEVNEFGGERKRLMQMDNKPDGVRHLIATSFCSGSEAVAQLLSLLFCQV